MKNLKNFFGFVVAFSMTLSLSGVVSTPILAVEENTDQVTENQTIQKNWLKQMLRETLLQEQLMSC